MITAADVRRVFPQATFGAPACEADIAEAERLLGHPLPSDLRNLYLEFDGFLGPTDATFLYPVLIRPHPGGESLATYTQFFRTETGMPDWLTQAIAVGDYGTGTAWFILLNEGSRVVRWDAEWEEYESVEGSLLDEWIKAKEFYESLLRDA